MCESVTGHVGLREVRERESEREREIGAGDSEAARESGGVRVRLPAKLPP